MRRAVRLVALSSVLAMAFGLVCPGASWAVPVTWVDWTSANATSASGTAGGVDVTFSGVLNPAAQTAGGTFFWGTNSAIYTSPPIADNPPPDPDIIRLTGGTEAGTQTITFSEPVTNPVMAILSLGQSSLLVTYDFGDEDFTVLNFGPGFFGGPGNLTELAGNVLQGVEGHGLIQFNGTFTSITWTIPTAEFWHGFQIGLLEPSTAVPTPAALLLLGAGLIGLGVRSRLRRR